MASEYVAAGGCNNNHHLLELNYFTPKMCTWLWEGDDVIVCYGCNDFFGVFFSVVSVFPDNHQKIRNFSYYSGLFLSCLIRQSCAGTEENSLLRVYPPHTVSEMGDPHPRSPGITQELCLFSFFSPDQPLPEGGVNKHPGPIPPLHQED